jgi:hypothetical protein
MWSVTRAAYCLQDFGWGRGWGAAMESCAVRGVTCLTGVTRHRGFKSTASTAREPAGQRGDRLGGLPASSLSVSGCPAENRP